MISMSASAGGGPTPWYAWVILFLSLLAVSSAGAVFQLIDGVAPLTKAAWRLQATTMVLLPGFIWQYRRADADLRRRCVESAGLLTASGVFLAIHFGTWLISLEHTTLTHSLLFVTAHPLVIIVGLWLLRRPASNRQTLGAVIGFAGAATTLIGGAGEEGVSIFGDLMAFVGAVSIVGYLAAGRSVRGWMPLFLYALPVTLIGTVILTLWAMLQEGANLSLDEMGGSLGWMSAAWILYVGYLALGPGLFGHTGINAILRWIPPLVISMTLIMEPVIGSVIGWFLETDVIPGHWTWLGGAMMVFGTIIVTRANPSAEEVG